MSTENALKVPLMGHLNVDLENENGRHFAEFHPPPQKTPLIKRFFLRAFVLLPWTLLVFLGGVWNWELWNEVQHCKARYYIRPELSYSPVQDIVEYELRTFTIGIPEDPDVSRYAAEPSPEVDELWKDLYPSLIQLIPQEKAAKLVNKTVIFPHDEQRRYAVELDVFHQLHCLNMVREATRPDYYVPVIPEGKFEDPDINTGHRHINHCIDTIRQSLMCASDISVYTWEWDEERQTTVNKVKNPHVCRNFDKIKEWATVNTKRMYFDGDHRVMDDPLDPSTWIDGYRGD